MMLGCRAREQQDADARLSVGRLIARRHVHAEPWARHQAATRSAPPNHRLVEERPLSIPTQQRSGLSAASRICSSLKSKAAGI